jgi:L-alanine-DL-glutamate epimerase-like enolase superfamily enzyme
MRDATGDRLDIMIEGHYRWDLATAIRIGRALAPFRITWMEDMTRKDNAVVGPESADRPLGRQGCAEL